MAKTRHCHDELFLPEHFEAAIRKAFGHKAKALMIELEAFVKKGAVVGTCGHITNPETGNCILVVSNQDSPGRLQIEYRYAVNDRDYAGGGVPRFGSSPESISNEISRMLKEKDREKVRFELTFKKCLSA